MVTTLYKLTGENGQTRGGTQWGPGVAHKAKGEADQPLCSDGWIHAYEHPLLAVLLNPTHARFKNPRLWEAEGEIGKRDQQLKCGCRKLMTIREIPLPVVTMEQRIRFAILCAKQVCRDPNWHKWADAWLDGSERSARAAAAARAAADAANVEEAEAATAAAPIDLIALAEQAVREEN